MSLINLTLYCLNDRDGHSDYEEGQLTQGVLSCPCCLSLETCQISSSQLGPEAFRHEIKTWIHAAGQLTMCGNLWSSVLTLASSLARHLTASLSLSMGKSQALLFSNSDWHYNWPLRASKSSPLSLGMMIICWRVSDFGGNDSRLTSIRVRTDGRASTIQSFRLNIHAAPNAAFRLDLPRLDSTRDFYLHAFASLHLFKQVFIFPTDYSNVSPSRSFFSKKI